MINAIDSSSATDFTPETTDELALRVFGTPNINGGTVESRAHSLRKILDGLQDTMDAMCEGAPHGRDFQVDAPGSYAVAREVHRVQVRQIADLLFFFETQMLALRGITRPHRAPAEWTTRSHGAT